MSDSGHAQDQQHSVAGEGLPDEPSDQVNQGLAQVADTGLVERADGASDTRGDAGRTDTEDHWSTKPEQYDLGQLYDSSKRGVEAERDKAEADYDQAAEVSGEASDGYGTGQDEGSID